MILICGPCVIENEEQLFTSAKEIIEIVERFPEIDFYFKASCIKDNRTSNNNFKGVGFDKGIDLLNIIRNRYSIKTTTDFHTAEQIRLYGNQVDLVQIPAFLAMQSELTDIASESSVPIHIKKPQFLNPKDINKPVRKIKDLNPDTEVFVTDRGTKFGYDEVIICLLYTSPSPRDPE